jgi:glycosyltransferase involved in cell wall biosynthesis
MHIGVDTRYLSHGLVGGVHTYVHNLVLAFARVSPERQYFLYADDKAPFELPDLPQGFTLRRLRWRSGASSVANDLRLGRAMARDGVAVAHSPANYGFAPATLPLVVTLHDAINLLPLRQIVRDDTKTPRHLAVMAYLHLMTMAALCRGPFVITVSHYSRQAILRQVSIPPDRVHVVHSAHDSGFRPRAPESLQDLRERLRLRPRMLLADAIKNPDCTLRAYRTLPATVRDQTSLVFFARRPPTPAVQRAASDGECLLIHRPPRETLIALYNLADLFIFPSWYEGFGLPALEAMACGTPVIASSRGSLPEIVGNGGIIFDAEDHAGIAGAIRSLFTDGGLARLRESALARAASFSWEQTAQRTLDVYDEVFRRWDHHSRPRKRGAMTAGRTR